jgi:hypothetical protein
MPKFQPHAAHIAAAQHRHTPFREVCIPLYLPMMEPPELSAPREIDLGDLVVDASGITIGGDDDDDGFL